MPANGHLQNPGDDLRAERFRVADQRLIVAEKLISHLYQLAEERRHSGLCTKRAEETIQRFEKKLESWTQHRAAMLERMMLDSPSADPPDVRPILVDPVAGSKSD